MTFYNANFCQMYDLIGYYEKLSSRACVEKILISHVINIHLLPLIEIIEMVSFELGEELRNMFFRLVTSGESNLRPSDLRSDARKSEVRFLVGTQNFYLSHARDKTKKHLSQHLPSSVTLLERYAYNI